MPGSGDRLVAIAQPVDEMPRLGLVGEKRRAVDQGAQIGLRDFSRRRDVADDLTVERAQQPLRLLALRPGHRILGEAVHRGLVFAPVVEIGGDPDALKRVAEERRLGVEPG